MKSADVRAAFLAYFQERGHAASTFYYENVEGGHGGAANNQQNAFMSTLAFEFLWKHLGDGQRRST